MKAKVCLALVLICISSTQPVWATDSLQRGANAYAARNYNQAVLDLTSAVQEEPDLDIAHYYLANALMKIGHRNHAIEEYKRACEVASTREIYQNCMAVFRTYNVMPPMRRPVRRPQRNGMLDPYTTNTMQAINAQAEGRQSKNWESDPQGVEVFKFTPENGDGMKQAWDQWIHNFRLLFGTQLNMIARGRVRERMGGAADMVFSVDSNHRLRGKIVKATTPESFNQSLIFTTQHISGSSLLTFPAGANIPGYNFTMNWDFGAPVARTAVTATLQSTGAALRTRDLNAAAGRLRPGGSSNDVSGKLTNKDVNGKVSSQDTLATLNTGSLTAQAKSLPPGFLPNFGLDVNGRVLPGKPLADLDASGKISPDKTAADLEAAAQALKEKPAALEVGGRVLPDKPATLDVGGQVLPDKPAGLDVGGRVLPEKQAPALDADGHIVPFKPTDTPEKSENAKVIPPEIPEKRSPAP